MHTREVWSAKPLDASGALVPASGGAVGGFLCTSSTSGTLQITAGDASGGDDIVAEMSVAAGTYYRLGFYCPLGAYAVLTNAAGTFQV
jgi:hypothetical protein